MRIYSPFNTLTGRIIFPCFAMTLLLIVSSAPTSHASEEPSGHAPPSTNPPGPHASVPSGIVGLALHITAGRIGDPAQLIIRAVHPSGPAAREGITHGEEILTVNEEPVAGKTYQEAVGLIRGEVGSTVKLGLRGPQGERTVSLVRVSESLLMEQTPEVM